MLERVFRDGRVLDRLRGGVLGARLDDLAAYLDERGHSSQMVEKYVRAIGHFDYNTQSDKPAVQGAFIFQYDPAAPALSSWRATAGTPLHARILADTVLLPDGTVFVVSGVSMGAAAGHSSSFVMEAELVAPTTETFTTAGSLDIGHPRGYHATAVLLPDGRVAVAGSTKAYNNNPDPGGPTPFDDTSIQIYSPAYCSAGPGLR